jgi:hypothetical protein
MQIEFLGFAYKVGYIIQSNLTRMLTRIHPKFQGTSAIPTQVSQ